MKTLQISRLKPNPSGKDKDRFGYAPAAQLGAEWVDIRNSGSAAVQLDGVKLFHVAFTNGSPSHWEEIMTFKGTLDAGAVLRVHAGKGPESALRPEDLHGARHHLFTNRDRYVWNNAEGDTARLTEPSNNGDLETDKASYDPYPPEGVVLVRSGAKLVPSAA